MTLQGLIDAGRDVFILAGNRRQFVNYCRKHCIYLSTSNLHYIKNHNHQLHGISKNSILVEIGTAGDHPKRRTEIIKYFIEFLPEGKHYKANSHDNTLQLRNWSKT